MDINVGIIGQVIALLLCPLDKIDFVIIQVCRAIDRAIIRDLDAYARIGIERVAAPGVIRLIGGRISSPRA